MADKEMKQRMLRQESYEDVSSQPFSLLSLEKLSPQGFTALCEKMLAQGEVASAVKIAVQVGHESKDVPLLIAAGMWLSSYTARHDIVIAIFKKALLLMPEGTALLASLRGELKVFLAGALMAAGQHEQAVAMFMEVAQTCPEHRVIVGEHLSMMLLEVGMPDQAVAVLEAWLKEGPASVSLYNNMGCALERLNRSEEALRYYRKGIDLSSMHEAVSFGYAISLLKAGHFEEGFQRYVQRTPRIPDLTCWFYKKLPRLTQGVNLAGKYLLFYQEQGLGDTIQFIRFLPEILRQAEKVTIAVMAPLYRLIKESFPQADVCLISTLAQESERIADFHFSCPIPDLPYVCGMKTWADLPDFSPYLTVPLARQKGFARLVADVVHKADCACGRAVVMPDNRSVVVTESPAKRRLRVGLVWAGEERFTAQDVAADKRRSTSFEQIIQALAPVKADLFNLQYGAKRSELHQDGGQPVLDLMDDVQDMADTAALMESLDLIISVDTAPLHLAAALGREVWLISRWDACWRWGDEGERTPWYPSMRIFRAQELSLEPVLKQAGVCLREYVARWEKEEN